jgi:hypothetical protein
VLSVEAAMGEPESELCERVCRDLGVDPREPRGFRIVKRSLDARRRGDVRRLRYVLHADLVLDASFRSERFARAARSGRVATVPRSSSLACILRRMDATQLGLRSGHATCPRRARRVTGVMRSIRGAWLQRHVRLCSCGNDQLVHTSVACTARRSLLRSRA